MPQFASMLLKDEIEEGEDTDSVASDGKIRFEGELLPSLTVVYIDTDCFHKCLIVTNETRYPKGGSVSHRFVPKSSKRFSKVRARLIEL